MKTGRSMKEQPPVCHAERLSWAQERVRAAEDAVERNPFDGAFQLALVARRAELADLETAHDRSARVQAHRLAYGDTRRRA